MASDQDIEAALVAEREAICDLLQSREPNTRAEMALAQMDLYMGEIPPGLADLLSKFCTAAGDELQEWQRLIRDRNLWSYERAVAWLAGSDTGISSKTIWSVMTGFPVDVRPTIPLDPSDFGRCYRLLQEFPGWRERMPEVAAKHEHWKPMVDAWDELTALYEEEVDNPSGMAPKLYYRMKELRGVL